MTTYHFAAVIEKDQDGYYAFCPELQGCYTSGDTFEEARDNLADAIRLHVEDRLAAGEETVSSQEPPVPASSSSRRPLHLVDEEPSG